MKDADVMQTLGAGVIADVFRTDERGFAMGIYTLGPLTGWCSRPNRRRHVMLTNRKGPTLGPLIGGFVSQNIGWRWDFWIVFIVGTVIVLMTEIFIVETNPHVLMARKVKRLQTQLGRPELRSCYTTDATPKTHTTILLNGLVRPMKMLFLSPLVFSLSLYMAFTYGGLCKCPEFVSLPCSGTDTPRPPLHHHPHRLPRDIPLGHWRHRPRIHLPRSRQPCRLGCHHSILRQDRRPADQGQRRRLRARDASAHEHLV